MQNQTRLYVLWLYLITGGYVVFISEILSVFNIINQVSIYLSWILLIVFIFLVKRNLKLKLFSNLKYFFKSYTLKKNYFSSIIGLIILITLVICFIYPPNTDDSYAYHLPKIMQWIQNQNLNNFPTSDYRQVSYSPLSEYFLMHFYLITNSDLLLNLPQWFAMVGSTITVSLIAKKLGAKQKTQILSAVFAVTIPMGILQSTSTQTDYMVSLWITISIFFLISYFKIQNLKNILGFSLALSLAILTKPTAYIFLFPFCLWLLFFSIKEKKLGNIFHLFLIPIILILINCGFFLRNFGLFSNPLGINLGVPNEIINTKIFLSNFVRNFSLNLTLPDVNFNEGLRFIVRIFHDFLNFSITDPSSTYSTEGRYGGDYFIYFSLYENTASNTFHFLLILTTIFVSFFLIKDYKEYRKEYLICLIGSFLFFCLILKWQPWGNRLLLPFFILFSPLVAILFSNLKFLKFQNFIFIMLIIYSLPYLLFNKTRPLLGNLYREGNEIVYNKPLFLNNDRNYLYFPTDSSYYNGFSEILKILNKNSCKYIGIDSDESAREYLIWLLVRKSENKDGEIFHINIKNKTQKIYNEEKLKKPCMVFLLHGDKSRERYHQNIFENTYIWKKIKFYF